ncbi:hypothetical protein K0040_15755 [Terrisporobacter petrolearius]|uniref:hypothetical protein n=1 Tax=Terrisporobacter petrolearius TaxID=1460447 RepID=UPI001D169C32|nr:hypothetical protein [Terrisporobacter petrolearius]MCC3865717.1 hypothetical protein [Terrisporobacter petrolearius]
MQLVKNKKIEDNDVYYFRIHKDFIIINNNYEGVIFLDSELQIINNIYIINDLHIYCDCFVNNKLILYCSENNCLACIDIKDFSVNIIRIPICYDIVSIKSYNNVESIIFRTVMGEEYIMNINNKNIIQYHNEKKSNESELIVSQHRVDENVDFSIEGPKFLVSNNNIKIAYNERDIEIIDTINNETHIMKTYEEWIYRKVEIYDSYTGIYIFILENNNYYLKRSKLICYKI